MVNVIDTTRSAFRGWITIRGLHSWNTETFEMIATRCGELMEVDKNTANFSVLTAAKVKSENHRNSHHPAFILPQYK